jgi:hypothetical protein
MPEIRSWFQPPAASSLILKRRRHKQGGREAALPDIFASGFSQLFEFSKMLATI